MATTSSTKEMGCPKAKETMKVTFENSTMESPASANSTTKSSTTEKPVTDGFNTVSHHRKMMALPALKILADLEHSEKSFDVLMAVMDRCCRETNNQGVFLGCGKDTEEHKLAFGNALMNCNFLHFCLPLFS